MVTNEIFYQEHICRRWSSLAHCESSHDIVLARHSSPRHQSSPAPIWLSPVLLATTLKNSIKSFKTDRKGVIKICATMRYLFLIVKYMFTFFRKKETCALFLHLFYFILHYHETQNINILFIQLYNIDFFKFIIWSEIIIPPCFFPCVFRLFCGERLHFMSFWTLLIKRDRRPSPELLNNK